LIAAKWVTDAERDPRPRWWYCLFILRSAKIDELAQRLARLTGEDIETALARAIEERLSRVAPTMPADRKAAMNSFFGQVSRMRVFDPRPANEIVGYDRDGLPS
jgi:antitoxin VapB